MTIHAALAGFSRAVDELKSRTVFDDIEATVKAVAAITDDTDIAAACVRDMMKSRYPALIIVEDFTLDESGDWHLAVEHFDGKVVAITTRE